MASEQSTRVGFIGLGNMGMPMASNLVKSGVTLIAFDSLPERTRPLVDLGAHAAADLAAVVDASDIVVTMLPDTPHVESIVSGPDGILSRGRKGLLHLDMSTIAPSGSKRFAALLEERGMHFIDAAVGRSAIHAERGESLFMVGAHDDTLRRVRPLLDAMGDTIIHCGPPGSGIAMKIVNNFQGNVQAQVTAEALVLGARLGLSVDRMVEVMSGSLSVNGLLAEYYPLKALAGDIEPGFAIDLVHKDLSIAMAIAAEYDVPVGVGVAALESVGRARRDFGGKDLTALLDAMAVATHIDPPRLAKG